MNKKPASLQSYINELKEAIKRYQALSLKNAFFLDDVKEKQERLKAVRKLWKEWGEHSVVQHMVSIVQKEVKSYVCDFFYHDLHFMTSNGCKRFAWFVRDAGTHIVLLDGPAEQIEMGQDYVDAIKSNFGDRCKLYLIDLEKYTLREAKNFDEITFNLLEQKTAPLESVI